MFGYSVKMLVRAAVVFCGLILRIGAENIQLPDGFKFGAATASYQIEGAWNVSDKSPSIWDNFLHGNDNFKDNGDITCNSYYLWERDIQIAQELGLQFYRFSLSWSRLLPSGFSNQVSEDGRQYYDNLINGLLKNGIEPLITIYHWDLPQYLQDLGGWTNPMISDWFADYARVVFSLYADRVKTWITLNEPISYCSIAYNSGGLAPGVKSPGIGKYLCAKNALMAHAKAWRIYDEEFRPKFQGRIGLTNAVLWSEPEGDDDGAAEMVMQYIAGLYSHPVYSKEGGWPSITENIIAQNSKEEGYPRSRLPEFTQEEIALVKGTFDFYGLNYYTSRLARKALPGEVASDLFGLYDTPVVLTVKPEWKQAATDWLYVDYEGFRKKLSWIKRNYGDIEIIITENGYSTLGNDLDDKDRVEYIEESLKQISLSIYEDGVNVTGYAVWSLMDNLEWSSGFSLKFGLYEVDFEDPGRKRTRRASGKVYAEIIRAHQNKTVTKCPLDFKRNITSCTKELCSLISAGSSVLALAVLLNRQLFENMKHF